MNAELARQAIDTLGRALEARGPRRAMLLDEALRLHRLALDRPSEARSFRPKNAPADQT